MNVKQLLKTSSLLILALALDGCIGCNLCKVEVLERSASPDGKLVATILTRDCGATTSEYMAVNLQVAKQERLAAENEVFVVKHVHRLHVLWHENDSLTIDCKNCNAAEVEKKLEKLGGVRVIYQ